MTWNVGSVTSMGRLTLFWGLMLSVSAVCICSTYGEGEYWLNSFFSSCQIALLKEEEEEEEAWGAHTLYFFFTNITF